MSLNLHQILPQLDRLSKVFAERRLLLSQALPRAKDGLERTQEQDPSELKRKVAAAGDRWPGASLTSEPVAGKYPAPTFTDRFTVIGADGSQIYPDRHAAALYFLINIGTICLAHNSQETPTTAQQAQLFTSYEDLYDNRGRAIQPALVNLKRDVAEMEALADAAGNGQTQPTIALLDNSLLLWMTLETDASAQQVIDLHLVRYLKALDRLRSLECAIAGIIDRPRNANTLSLIHLAGLALDDIDGPALEANPFFGLTDIDLFNDILPAGHRSARFSFTSPLNRDFERSGHAVQFFYLNTGWEIVRVEIPAWVGEQPALLDLLHAALIQECRSTGGFPYSLVRAHELAVINPTERELVDQHVERRLLLAGEYRRRSQKSITKGWTQGRRRHRL